MNWRFKEQPFISATWLKKMIQNKSGLFWGFFTCAPWWFQWVLPDDNSLKLEHHEAGKKKARCEGAELFVDFDP